MRKMTDFLHLIAMYLAQVRSQAQALLREASPPKRRFNEIIAISACTLAREAACSSCCRVKAGTLPYHPFDNLKRCVEAPAALHSKVHSFAPESSYLIRQTSLLDFHDPMRLTSNEIYFKSDTERLAQG
ncbi:hypothetical protein EV356DRAFT_223801 [Viridothelium virens]|uniref:Uncharacterized protein n=1 Tax=Viridothelium virens TaxID=1048519 RepID=A0A6A6HN87_VIRVR|nr:hypothetical protein EV356DRAFT_223801 [Viridothelium virens]